MIQRKQTLFLLAALVLTTVCLCLPIGRFTPDGMGGDFTMFNLWVTTPDGTNEFSVWALFAILLLTIPFNMVAIFGYKNRKLQARLCMFNSLLIIGWYAVYAAFAKVLDYGSFHVSWVAALPFASLVFYFLARKGVLADEALVRAADRIR